MGLAFEENRLKTFDDIDWPHDFISTETLAKTGFYYHGPPDQVRCYFCKVVVRNWSPGDSEVGEHMFWSSNCPLLRRRRTNNIPIQPEADLWELLAAGYGFDEPDNAIYDTDTDTDSGVSSDSSFSDEPVSSVER